MTKATILARVGTLGPGPGFMQCFILCLEYTAKQATFVLISHVNAVNGVTYIMLS